MKKLIQKCLIVFAIALSVNSNAQTTINLSNIIDSTLFGALCPPPIPVSYQAMGTVTGYNPAVDSITLHYFWDDGLDTIFKVGITSSTFDYFWTNGIPHIYTSAGTYDIKVVALGPDGNSDTLIAAPIVVSSGCVTIDGYTYIDNNSNCVFDAADDTLAGISLPIKNSLGVVIGYAYSNSSGYYSTTVGSGLTGLVISSSAYWGFTISPSCPVSGSYTFNSTGSMSFNFGYTCPGSGFDLSVSHGFSGVGAPGSNGSISFFASNLSCSSMPATITLTLDPSVTYVSMILGPAPTSVVGNVLTWNTTLAASGYYFGAGFNGIINMLTNTGATLMDPAYFNLTISPTVGDSYAPNNSHNWSLLIGGPYDPNSKEVSPAGVGATGEIAPNTELTYTLNFQNTGTAPAINVSVLDTIDTDLDMSTFHIIASSHFMNPEFYEGNIVRFVYPNIMLPDSNANEPLSHGWVKYSLKTKSGLTSGTQIKNTGHIFFDYNPAIVTNTTLNTINIAAGVEENEMALSTLIYPNPAKDQFTLEFGEQVNGVLSIIDVTGRVVKTINVNKTDKISVNTQELSSGLYGLSFPGVTLKQSRVQIIK